MLPLCWTNVLKCTPTPTCRHIYPFIRFDVRNDQWFVGEYRQMYGYGRYSDTLAVMLIGEHVEKLTYFNMYRYCTFRSEHISSSTFSKIQMKFFEYFLTIPLLFVKQTKRKKELIIKNFHFCSIFLLNSFKFLCIKYKIWN